MNIAHQGGVKRGDVAIDFRFLLQKLFLLDGIHGGVGSYFITQTG